MCALSYSVSSVNNGQFEPIPADGNRHTAESGWSLFCAIFTITDSIISSYTMPQKHKLSQCILCWRSITHHGLEMAYAINDHGHHCTLRFFGAKPLSKPVMIIHRLETTSVKFQSKSDNFHSTKNIWKLYQPNDCHFMGELYCSHFSMFL